MRIDVRIAVVLSALAVATVGCAPGAVPPDCWSDASEDACAPPPASWRPVRVSRDTAGRAHFFEVWDPTASRYENRVLVGYDDLYLGYPLDGPDSNTETLDALAGGGANLIRLWIYPSAEVHGAEPSAYYRGPGTDKVDLDTWNPAFFARLDEILTRAETRGVVVEVMMWNHSEGWRGNVHNPQNHYRSRGGPPLSLPYFPFHRVGFREWYDTNDAERPSTLVWRSYQRGYMCRVMQEVVKHDNVLVELKNELSATTLGAQAWRCRTHAWFRTQFPSLLVQSESIPGEEGDLDAREWGFSLLDMVATHSGLNGPSWDYDRAQARYHESPSVVPACSEDLHFEERGVPLYDLPLARRVMWGLTLGGGAAYLENIRYEHRAYLGGVDIGARVSAEIQEFFIPADDPPAFWRMAPRKDLVALNAGDKYVLADDDGGEVLVFADERATSPFALNGAGPYRYRTFDPDAARGRRWGAWQAGTSWTFPPMPWRGLHVQTAAARRPN